MITSANFKKYEPIVNDAIIQLFEHCIAVENNENDFLLFLKNARYEKKYEKEGTPFVIGLGESGAVDLERLSFLKYFVKLPFEKDYINTTDRNEQFEIRRMSNLVSLLVYTQIWESKFLLRRLRLLAILAEGNPYDWHLEVNPLKIYDFIKDDIREIFKTLGLKIYNIIKDSYKSQLRNAFAHVDFSTSYDRILLLNYDESDSYTEKEITNEEFDKIIILSTLINYSLDNNIIDYSLKYGFENPERIITNSNGNPMKLIFREQYKDWVWAD